MIRLRRLFGVTLASDFPFAIPLPALSAIAGAPDLTFAVAQSSPDLGGSSGPAVYTSPLQLPDGTSGCRLYRLPDREALAFPQTEFHLWPNRIVCHLPEPALRHLVETYLLGPVLAYWLERRGTPVLHASAVAAEGRAAAFLGARGAGKSGVAAALLEQGADLLGDDLVPLGPLEEDGGTPLAVPGFPAMRMWPDEAARFLGRWEHLPRVSPEAAKRWVPVGPAEPGGFGSFAGSPVPLSALYLLDRRTDGGPALEIREVPPRDALIELTRHSFAPRLVDAAGLRAGRFDRLAQLAGKVPVRRLLYPSGFERLPRVAERILRDLLG